MATNKLPKWVIVKTKGNHRRLNNTRLSLVEIAGRRVSALVLDTETQKMIIVDFTLSEVVEFVKE